MWLIPQRKFHFAFVTLFSCKASNVQTHLHDYFMTVWRRFMVCRYSSYLLIANTSAFIPLPLSVNKHCTNFVIGYLDIKYWGRLEYENIRQEREPPVEEDEQ